MRIPAGDAPHLRFAGLDRYGALIAHAVFTREGGVSTGSFASLNVSYSTGDDPVAVAENRARCAAVLGLTPAQLVTAGLVHGTDVAVIEDPTMLERQRDGTHFVSRVDALVTDRPDLGLLITAADCLQVLLFDPQRRVIALAHAGWRGLVAGVLTRTVQTMSRTYGSTPGQLVAGIGPGLGPCCAAFSDPAHELPAGFQRYVRADRHVDLWAAAHDQLAASGLVGSQIEHQALCTVCHRDRFFSHRGDHGRTGRFAAILTLRR
jgi:YfiH family protein